MKSKYLFFDTETNGLPANWRAPASDINNWPRVVQLACCVYTDDQKLIYEESAIIKPEGWVIPKEASDIHRITNERALAEGVKATEVFIRFFVEAASTEYLVGHNVSFDYNVMSSELFRLGLSLIVPLKRICTMESSTEYCSIPCSWGHKWPKLNELYRVLFKEELQDAHDARVDLAATVKCFWELKRIGVIKE